jgi:hypothetical protein
MGNKHLIKIFIDFLYFTYFSGIIGLIALIPISIFIVSRNEIRFENIKEKILIAVALFIGTITYIIFFRGLFLLRKVATQILLNKLFSMSIITNMKKTGKYFTWTGVLLIITYTFIWFGKLFNNKIEIIFSFNSLIPFLLIIFGLFFIIQSNALDIARRFKEENELTI